MDPKLMATRTSREIVVKGATQVIKEESGEE